jgi:hypothetical protein
MATISADIVWRPAEGAINNNLPPEFPEIALAVREVGHACLASSVSNERAQDTDTVTGTAPKQRSDLFLRFRERECNRKTRRSSLQSRLPDSPTKDNIADLDEKKGAKRHPVADVHPAHTSHIEFYHSLHCSQSQSLAAEQSFHEEEDIELSGPPKRAARTEPQFTLEQLSSLARETSDRSV